MIQLLSRWLIHDRDNVSSPAVRRAYGTLCGAVGIALNILLFAGKFFAGQLSGSIAVTGDMIADLTEDLAAEQKARLTYDNILRLSDDPDVNDAIKFLRAREIVHFQRFGEGLRLAKDRLNEKNVYFMNPSFDK